MQVKRGDKFILHSENGMDYEIHVVNVNEYREPSMICGCDIFLDGASVNEDIWFCGEDFLLSEKCEKIHREDPEEVIGIGNAEKMGNLINKLTEALDREEGR